LDRSKRRKFHDAQDRLFVEICRCQVLDAADEDVETWLDDTVEYLAEEYPSLTHSEVSKLRLAGENFVAPPIPHGAARNATNREEWT
jgi:hypothetical protein